MNQKTTHVRAGCDNVRPVVDSWGLSLYYSNEWQWDKPQGNQLVLGLCLKDFGGWRRRECFHRSPMKHSAYLSFLTLASFALAGPASAAVVASYSFTSNLSSGDSQGSSLASAIQSGGGLGTQDTSWGRSGGQSDLYIRGNVTDTVASLTDFVFFTVTISPGTTYDFTNLTFKHSIQIASGGTIPFNSTIIVRSSLNGYASALGTFQMGKEISGGPYTAETDPSVNLSAYTGVSGIVEFRFYIQDDGDHTNNVTRIDDIQLNANVIPEPASGVMLLGAGALAAFRRRRR